MSRNEFPPIEAAKEFNISVGESFKSINNSEYEFRDGIYNLLDDQVIRNKLINFLDSIGKGEFITENYLKSTLLCLKAFREITGQKASECKMLNDDQSGGIYIPVGNGIITLYCNNGSYTHDLCGYNNQLFATNKLQVNYERKVISKRFLKLLKEVMPSKEQRLLLQ